jgi:hypothetical protein
MAGWHEVRVPVGTVEFEARAFEDGALQEAKGTAVAKAGKGTSVEPQFRPRGALSFSYSHRGQVIPVDATEYALSFDGFVGDRGSLDGLVGRNPGLRAGRWVLQLWPPSGFLVARVPVDVPPNGEAHVRVELTARAR